jgi:DNA-directed RNA polymerase beta' subunit
MKLEIRNINEFIEKNKLQQVKTIRLYEKVNKTEPTGLFSEEIFGRFGSSERRKTFAYVDLKVKVIHPECLSIFLGLDTTVSKLIMNKEKYIIDDGALIESDKGNSGVDYFIRNFDKIDLSKFKNKQKTISFLKKNKDSVFIDKFLILPAGIRDITTSVTSGKTLVVFADLSELYSTLVRQTNALGNVTDLPEDLRESMVETIQRTVLSIDEWIKNRLKGKFGLINGGLLSKVADYSGRLIITTDHSLNLGDVGLPYQVVLKLFEPFTINYILKKDSMVIGSLQHFMKSDQPLDINDVKRLLTNMINNPESTPSELVDYFIHVAKEIVKDKVVLYKRDPVNDRDHWLCGNVRVDSKGSTLMLNPLDLPRMGGDHDGDAVAVIPVFTKEAIAEAKEKMHPRHTESIWTRITNSNQCPYQITHDAATAIYAATK